LQIAYLHKPYIAVNYSPWATFLHIVTNGRMYREMPMIMIASAAQRAV